jgi:Cu2+-exporting ATPase
MVIRVFDAELHVPAEVPGTQAEPRLDAGQKHDLRWVHCRRPVVMVGDGVNDTAAISRATVGVGMHGGAEACLSSADVFLSRPGLAGLVTLVIGAARTLRVIRRNIVFSLAYNVVGASLAMTGVINPLIAAVLMPASSLTVILASWLSRTFEADRK